jgi:hypothetical protein
MRFLLGIFCCFFILGCSDIKPDLPDEIQIGKKIYEAKVATAHHIGPAGLNKRFIVYELSPATQQNLITGGLDYINRLPSIPRKRAAIKPPKIYNAEGRINEDGSYTPPMTGYWTEPFLTWEKALIPKDKRWYNDNLKVPEGTKEKQTDAATLNAYFGKVFQDDERVLFVSLIAPEWVSVFNEAEQDPNSVFSYGGPRKSNVVIISPEKGLLFFLYRN